MKDSDTITIFDGHGVDFAEVHECTWGDFVAVNADGMDASDFAHIETQLDNFGISEEGGGAASAYTIKKGAHK